MAPESSKFGDTITIRCRGTYDLSLEKEIETPNEGFKFIWYQDEELINEVSDQLDSVVLFFMIGH